MSIVSKDKNDRVMFFVDIRNVINGCKEATGCDRVEYGRMVDYLADGRKVAAAYIFDGAGESKKLHKALAYQGFRIMTRNSFDPDEKVQKEVDVALACMLTKHATQDDFDVAVVVSGDRDFLFAVELVQSMGKRVEVASFEACFSKHMLRGCDDFTYLDTLPIVVMESEEEETEEEETAMGEPTEAEAF